MSTVGPPTQAEGKSGTLRIGGIRAGSLTKWRIVLSPATKRPTLFAEGRIARYYVQGVVETPFSGHPTANHRFYHHDETHLREYIQLAATPQGFTEYIEKYVNSAREVDYLGKTSVAEG